MRFGITVPETSERNPNPLRLNKLYEELRVMEKEVNTFAVQKNPGRPFEISVMRVVNTQKTKMQMAPTVMTEIQVDTFKRSYRFSTINPPVATDHDATGEPRTFSSDRDALTELLEYVNEILADIERGFAEKRADLGMTLAVLRRSV